MMSGDENQLAQRAGNNSSQTINIGLTIDQARELVDDRIAREFANFRSQSEHQISERLNQFADRLIAGLVKADRLDAASDPNLWTAIQSAAREAAGSDSDEDITFLVNLLVERTKHMTDRRRRAVIDGAIRVINSLDTDTLTGITTLYVLFHHQASVMGGPGSEFKFSSILLKFATKEGGLPRSMGWVQHAITLGAAYSVIGLVDIESYYLNKFASYLSPGIPDAGSEYDRGMKAAHRVGHSSLAWGHPYIPNRMITRWSDMKSIANYAVENNGMSSTDAVKLAEEMRDAWNMGVVDSECKERLLQDLRDNPELQALDPWLASLRPPIILTAIGEMVGLINLRRITPQNTQENASYVM